MIKSISPVLQSNLSRSIILHQLRHLSSPPPSDDLPQMYHLEHIQKRLEYTVPLMFQQKLDFTFYRNDVICDNLIMNIHKEGLQAYMSHLGVVSVWGQMCFPYIKMAPLSINLIHEDGSVRLRWRVAYLNWLSVFNYKNFNHEYREKHARWYDGNATFYVDANGLVYKVIIQKMTPDDSFTNKTTKKIVEKMGILPQNSTNFVEAPPSHTMATKEKKVQ